MHAHCIEGVARSEVRKGANGDGNGNGAGAGAGTGIGMESGLDARE